MAKATGMNDPSNIPGPPGEDFQPSDIRRVFGAVSAPEDIKAIENRQGNAPLDMNFFVRIQFKTAEAAAKAYKGMEDRGQKTTIGGKEFSRPPADDQNSPSNLLARLSQPDTIEVGTDAFLLANPGELFTPNLLASWKKLPKASIRLSADFDGARKIINDGLAEAQKGEGGFMLLPVVTVAEKTQSMRFALDFSGKDMLWLAFSSGDEAGAGVVKQQLDGLLTTAKQFGNQGLGQIPAPKLKQVPEIC